MCFVLKLSFVVVVVVVVVVFVCVCVIRENLVVTFCCFFENQYRYCVE